jgi:hypothetical protein
VQFELTLASYDVSSVPEVSQVTGGRPSSRPPRSICSQLGFGTIATFDDPRTTRLTPVSGGIEDVEGALNRRFHQLLLHCSKIVSRQKYEDHWIAYLSKHTEERKGQEPERRRVALRPCGDDLERGEEACKGQEPERRRVAPRPCGDDIERGEEAHDPTELLEDAVVAELGYVRAEVVRQPCRCQWPRAPIAPRGWRRCTGARQGESEA